MHNARLLVKFLILPFFLVVFFNFLEYGLVWDRWDQFVYPITLMIVSCIVFYIPKSRKISLIISFVFLSTMIALYLINKLNLADTIGSFGFALLLVSLSIYLPEIIRKGFIEKF